MGHITTSLYALGQDLHARACLNVKPCSVFLYFVNDENGLTALTFTHHVLFLNVVLCLFCLCCVVLCVACFGGLVILGGGNKQYIPKNIHPDFYTPRFNEVDKGVYWYHLVRLSVCRSVRLWTESCPLCIFNNTHLIYFIFAHLIKQLQKVCRV